MQEKTKKNFIWNFIGSLIFGFTSLFFMMITTRVNGIEDAGIFTYCFATACILYAVAAYCGKTFQITDIKNQYSDTDYIYNRLFTYIIAIIAAVIFILCTGCDGKKGMVLFLLTLYRGLDAIMESFHAITQKNGNLYRAGISLFARAVVITGVFFLVNYGTKNLVLACLAIVITGVLFLIGYDIPSAKPIKKTPFSWRRNFHLLRDGTYTFLFSFLTIYLLNAPRYALELLGQNDLQAIYGIIIMPASFLSLVAGYIIQPFLVRIGEMVGDKKYHDLKVFLFKISAFVAVCGGCCMIGGYFLGEPVLELLYGIDLVNQQINLVIILLASTFYALSSFFSAVLIAMRKTFSQLMVLIIDAFSAILVCYYIIPRHALLGASLSYLFIMFFQFTVYLFLIEHYSNSSSRKVTMRLAGGLGNQMFEYCALRSHMLKYHIEGELSLKGITNKTHNVYSLNHFCISKKIKITKREGIKSSLNYLLYGFYYVFLGKRKNGFRVMQKMQPILNYFGFYCVPDGYMELQESPSRHQVMVGYYQSLKYFEEYKDILKKELRVKEKVLPQNKKILDKIKKETSVCVHIRRGDYVGSNHQVCTIEYYQNAMQVMKKRVKDPTFFIFSDDIAWVKEHLKSNEKMVFIEGNNPNYEELRLMYHCKHFIISNSSFSWWAQYLTDSKKRITIAPSKWFQNPNQKVDIYEDDWILIEV